MADGRSAPKYHAWSRPKVVEREATYRAIALAELVDQPIQVFHVSCPEVAEEIARAQARGLKVWAETCPQYFVLGAADMDRPGFEGAKFMCSPSPRDAASQRGAVGATSAAARSTWCRPITAGPATRAREASASTATTRRSRISRTACRAWPRGCRSMFSEGVARGRIDLNPFRAADRDQPGEAVRAVSAQGHHRAWIGRRPGAVGSGQARDDHQRR